MFVDMFCFVLGLVLGGFIIRKTFIFFLELGEDDKEDKYEKIVNFENFS